MAQSDCGFNFVKALLMPVLRAGYDISVKGRENLIKDSPILALNHLSFWDPFFVITALDLRKPIHFLAKKWDNRVIDSFLGYTGQILLGRHTKAVYGEVADALERGRVAGVFYQGGRTRDLSKSKDGAAYFAFRTGHPVIPVYISGSEKAWPIGRWYPTFNEKIEVILGNPLFPKGDATRENISGLTKDISDAIKNMDYEKRRNKTRQT